jgi:hypothetical protein
VLFLHFPFVAEKGEAYNHVMLGGGMIGSGHVEKVYVENCRKKEKDFIED